MDGMDSVALDDCAGLDVLLDIINSEAGTAESAVPSTQEEVRQPVRRRKLPRFSSASDTGALPLLRLPAGVPTFYTRSEDETDELCASIEAEVAGDAGLDLIGFDIE